MVSSPQGPLGPSIPSPILPCKVPYASIQPQAIRQGPGKEEGSSEGTVGRPALHTHHTLSLYGDAAQGAATRGCYTH